MNEDGIGGIGSDGSCYDSDEGNVERNENGDGNWQ